MGLLCHLKLDLCTPDQATSGLLPYTDGATQDVSQFNTQFPYLKTPIAGSPNTN
jgi:hypothetical protein